MLAILTPMSSYADRVSKCLKLEKQLQKQKTKNENLNKRQNVSSTDKLYVHTISGQSAYKSGLKFECDILKTLMKSGFVPVEEKFYSKKIYLDHKIVILDSYYPTIYNRKGKTEFVLVSKTGKKYARIEAKFQSHAGSTDQKIAYWLLNAIFTTNEKNQILVVGSTKNVQETWKDIIYFVDEYKKKITKGHRKLQKKNIQVMSLQQLKEWLESNRML